MARRVEAHDSFDDFPTPPWGTRALMEHILLRTSLVNDWQSAWEPACNRGYMVRPLREYFNRVYASDIFDYDAAEQERVVDFLWPDSESPVLKTHPPQWIITNPPFRLAEQFIERASAIATVGWAMLVRTSFLEGIGRYERLFSTAPPTIVAQFVERLPMVKGRVDRSVSTATSYAWLVWMLNHSPRPFQWIPPCRAQLERDNDYSAGGERGWMDEK